MADFLQVAIILQWFGSAVITADRTRYIGFEAYVYAYPKAQLTIMEIMR